MPFSIIVIFNWPQGLHKMTTRRTFLLQALSSGALLLRPSDGWSLTRETYNTFDFHSHPGLFIAKGSTRYGGDEGVAKTVNEMNEGHLAGAFFSLVADAPIIKTGPDGISPNGSYAVGEAWKEYKRQLSILKDFIGKLPVTFAVTAADLEKGLRQKRVAAYIGIEGGDFLEGRSDRLDEMHADGVRSVQLVHYHPNELGNLQTEAPQIVRKMNKLKMLIDVAHAAESTVKTVTDITDSPIILSHSILQVDSKRPLAKRAISTSHAKLIAATRGVIGAWPSGYNTSLDDFIDNTKRLIDVVGIDHVGLGTDMDGNFKPVISSYREIPAWTDALSKKGFTKDEVVKITSGNAARVLKATIG